MKLSLSAKLATEFNEFAVDQSQFIAVAVPYSICSSQFKFKKITATC